TGVRIGHRPDVGAAVITLGSRFALDGKRVTQIAVDLVSLVAREIHALGADLVDDRIRGIVQLGHIDRIRVIRALGHVGDLFAARINAVLGDTRAILDGQAVVIDGGVAHRDRAILDDDRFVAATHGDAVQAAQVLGQLDLYAISGIVGDNAD